MGSRPQVELEVYYDGACPLCAQEMRSVQRRDGGRRIGFVDIAAEGFDPASAGVTREALMDRVHARLPDGALVEGVEVFRRLYTILGLGWLVAPTRLPGVARLLDLAYRLLARNRNSFRSFFSPAGKSKTRSTSCGAST